MPRVSVLMPAYNVEKYVGKLYNKIHFEIIPLLKNHNMWWYLPVCKLKTPEIAK